MLRVLVDFSPQLSAARDQGFRPTCLAFAASDGHSFARGLPAQALSAEYAFYHAVRRMDPSVTEQGATPRAMFDAIAVDGQPEEYHYPYLSPTPFATLPAPPTPFHYPVYKYTASLAPARVNDVVRALERGNSPVLGLEITEGFRMASGAPALVQLVPGDSVVGRHAVLAVGLAVDKSNTEYVKIRNSWGCGWADAGHAWLSRPYVEQRLLMAATFQ